MSRAIDFNRYCLIWSMLLMTWEDIHVSVTICRNFRLFYFVFFKCLIYQDEHWYVVLIVYALVYFLQFISLKKHVFYLLHLLRIDGICYTLSYQLTTRTATQQIALDYLQPPPFFPLKSSLHWFSKKSVNQKIDTWWKKKKTSLTQKYFEINK